MFVVGQIHNDFLGNPVHRLAGPPKRKRDYELTITGMVLSYRIAPTNGVWAKRNIPKGISCFIPSTSPHGRLGVSTTTTCAFISQLPNNWSAVYTSMLSLRLSDGSVTSHYHFHLYPTVEISEKEFLEVVTANVDRSWQVCNAIGGCGLPSVLHEPFADDDLEPLLRTILYYIGEWYRITDDLTDQLIMNDIYTWISTKKPEFREFIQDTCRSGYVEYYINKALSSIEDFINDPTGEYLLMNILEEMRLESSILVESR